MLEIKGKERRGALADGGIHSAEVEIGIEMSEHVQVGGHVVKDREVNVVEIEVVRRDVLVVSSSIRRRRRELVIISRLVLGSCFRIVCRRPPLPGRGTIGRRHYYPA